MIVAFSAAGVFPVHSEFWDLRDGVAGSSDSAASMWTDKVAGIQNFRERGTEEESRNGQ